MATPSTTIVLSNYPKPSGPNHVVTFASAEARATSVAAYAVHSSSGNYFVRPETGQLRVGSPFGSVDMANYGYFKNGDGRYYFFNVDHVEYVNDETTRIWFEIDVLATFEHDYQRTPQYVLREHVLDDTVGANLQPEPVGTGELEVQWQTRTASNIQQTSNSSYDFDLLEPCVFIFSAEKPGGEQVDGGFLDGTYEGCGVFACPLPRQENGSFVTDELDSWLYRMNRQNRAESIVAMTLFPYDLCMLQRPAAGAVTELFDTYNPFYTSPRTFSVHERPTTLGGGYVPRNNKLFTYPYSFMRCTNYKGQFHDYRYEFIADDENNGELPFLLKGSPDPSGDIWCCPVEYNGCAGENPEYAITMGGIPQISWSFNSYQNWLAGNAGSLAMNLLSVASMFVPAVGALRTASLATKAASALAGGVSSLAGTAARAGVSTGVTATASGLASALGSTARSAGTAGVQGLLQAGTGAAGLAATLYDQAQVPDGMRGQTTNAATAGYGCYGFSFMGLTLREEFAECVDDFFDRYGYAVNEVKVPNESGRANWNYVQTQGASFKSVTGAAAGVPAWALERIDALYDEGVWFWHDLATAGDFSQDNSIS